MSCFTNDFGGAWIYLYNKQTWNNGIHPCLCLAVKPFTYHISSLPLWITEAGSENKTIPEHVYRGILQSFIIDWVNYCVAGFFRSCSPYLANIVRVNHASSAHWTWMWLLTLTQSVSNQLAPMKTEYGPLVGSCFTFIPFFDGHFIRTQPFQKWIWHLSLETIGDRTGQCLYKHFTIVKKKQENKTNSLKYMPYRWLKQQQHLFI